VTRGALEAEVTLTVLGASAEIPVGTTLWSLPPAPGSGGAVPKRARVLRPLWQDLPPEIEQPGLFFIDEEMVTVTKGRVRQRAPGPAKLLRFKKLALHAAFAIGMACGLLLRPEAFAVDGAR
jgi:hypothetical protein